MKVVTPKVFLIASTGLETEGLHAWLDHVGGMKCLDTICIGTGIVWTANFRALRWVIEQRTSEGAEVEFRMAFNPVAETAVKKWPYLFGDFTPVDTGDGEIRAWLPTYHKV